MPRSPLRRVVMPSLLLLALCGCQALSRMAYSVGAFLDPEHRPCRDDIGSCALCGEPPSHPGGMGSPDDCPPPGPVAPASYGCPQCGGPGSAWGATADLPAQVADIQQRTVHLQEQLDSVTTEAAERGQTLIQTRAEFARVQSELARLRQQLLDWEQSVQGLQAEMRHRDRERMESLNALLSKLERIVAENQLE